MRGTWPPRWPYMSLFQRWVPRGRIRRGCASARSTGIRSRALCPERHSSKPTATRSLLSLGATTDRYGSVFEAMERDCQFLAPPHQYEDQLLHQLMMVGEQDPAGAAGVRAGGGERKRRFTEEQVRSLETTFHARRAKLEPKEKAELARELGLQPRQVAIWFQNKRARWRSKQLEHDYADLRARYDALRDRVEALAQEKAALAAQLDDLKLKGRLNERRDQSCSCDVDNGGTTFEVDDKRKNNSNSVSSPDDGAVAPAGATSEDSTAGGYYDDVAYAGLSDPFCNPPELWDAWPLLEWNAVA